MSCSERDRMLAGELYRPSDPHIQAELAATAAWLARYNTSMPIDRQRILAERLGGVGHGTEVRTPFFCDYGFNIRLGAGAVPTPVAPAIISPTPAILAPPAGRIRGPC
jgi:maltose O-acetyltransferase